MRIYIVFFALLLFSCSKSFIVNKHVLWKVHKEQILYIDSIASINMVAEKELVNNGNIVNNDSLLSTFTNKYLSSYLSEDALRVLQINHERMISKINKKLLLKTYPFDLTIIELVNNKGYSGKITSKDKSLYYYYRHDPKLQYRYAIKYGYKRIENNDSQFLSAIEKMLSKDEHHIIDASRRNPVYDGGSMVLVTQIHLDKYKSEIKILTFEEFVINE